MQSDFYKCFKCGKRYEEFTSNTYAEDHLCDDCKGRKRMKTFWKFIIVAAIVAVLVLSLYSVFAQENRTIVNETGCTGDACLIATNNITETIPTPVDDSSYTYEENYNDPLCWARINFCNAGYNLTDDLNKNELTLVNTLKQTNYQLSSDLANCTIQIGNMDTMPQDNTLVYVLLIITIIAALWATYVTIQLRRKN